MTKTVARVTIVVVVAAAAVVVANEMFSKPCQTTTAKKQKAC